MQCTEKANCSDCSETSEWTQWSECTNNCNGVSKRFRNSFGQNCNNTDIEEEIRYCQNCSCIINNIVYEVNTVFFYIIIK